MINFELDGRRVGVIILHNRCTMNCLFCITDSSLQEMTPEIVYRVLNLMKDRKMENVVFGGGEPLEWRYSLAEVICYAKKLGFTTQVGTNGVKLSKETINQLDVDRYVLPLDSVNPAIHNYLRQGRGDHFTIIKKTLRDLTDFSIYFTISTVVCSYNINELEKIAEFLYTQWLKGAKIHAWHLYRFLPYGRGGTKNKSKLEISYDTYIEATESVKKSKLPFLVYRRPDMQYSREVDFFWVQSGEIKIGSVVWKNRILISGESNFRETKLIT